jgi:hypothetical protein
MFSDILQLVTNLVKVTISINPLLGLVTQGIHYSKWQSTPVAGTVNCPQIAEVTWVITWLLKSN